METYVPTTFPVKPIQVRTGTFVILLTLLPAGTRNESGVPAVFLALSLTGPYPGPSRIAFGSRMTALQPLDSKVTTSGHITAFEVEKARDYAAVTA